MIYGVGTVSDIIVVIEVNIIMDHYSAAVTSVITVVVIIIIMAVDTYCHYCKSCKIRRVVPVVIWRIIRYVHRRVDILNYWRLFNHHNCGRCGGSSRNWISSGISRVRSNGRGRRSRLDDVILTIKILVSDDLHRDFPILVLRHKNHRNILYLLCTYVNLQYE